MRRRESTEAYGGELAGNAAVESAFSAIRRYVGDDVKMRLSWDRTGIQEFAIPLNGSPPRYATKDLFGAFGRFRLSADSVTNLPVDSIGFAYKVNGDDIVIEADELTFRGLASQIENPAPSGSPFGIEPISLIMAAFTVVRMIIGIMNPKVSLMLGGNVTCEATLNGDAMTVVFTQCPSVKVVAFWELTLEVAKAVITSDKATLTLRGEGFIAARIRPLVFSLT